MSIQDLGAIGEFISSVAIVITLIFLTIETRRAREATRQSNRHARQRIRTDLGLAVSANPNIAEILAKTPLKHPGGETPIPTTTDFGLSDAEALQLHNYFLAYTRYLEDQFFSDLPDSDRRALESQASVLGRIPYASEWWDGIKEIFDPRFQEYVEEMKP
jgi:hypothetical protein